MTMTPSQVKRAHTLLTQRDALLRLTEVAAPVGEVTIRVHRAVDVITGPFGADGLNLKLADEVREAKEDVTSHLTRTFKGIFLARLDAVDRELRELGVDVPARKAGCS